MLTASSGIFIVDHACKTMHKADKTGALLWKYENWNN